MALKRKISRLLIPVQHRLLGLQQISPDLDLGNGVSVAALSAKAEQVKGLLAQINTLLATHDGMLNDLRQAERELAELNSRALSMIKAVYGADSIEYQLVGGVRLSERVRRAKRARARSVDG